jgi:hypothetical protein
MFLFLSRHRHSGLHLLLGDYVKIRSSANSNFEENTSSNLNKTVNFSPIDGLAPYLRVVSIGITHSSTSLFCSQVCLTALDYSV